MGKTLISLFLTADISVHPCIHMPKSIMYGFKTSPKWEKLSGTKRRRKTKGPGFFYFFIIFVHFKNVHICLINASPSPSPPSTTSEAHFMLLVWNNKVLQAMDCIVCRRPLFIALTVSPGEGLFGWLHPTATRSSEGATHRKGLGAAKIAFVSSHNLLYCNILLFLYIFCHTKGNHLHLHICCTQNQGIFIAFHIAISVTTLLF